MRIEITNATDVFARDNQFWEFGGFTFSKPITQTQFIWVGGILAAAYFLFTILASVLPGMSFIISLLWTWAPALVLAYPLGKKLGDTSEKFDGMTAGKYLLAKRRWKNQARGYLDCVEYDPNAKRIYRIASAIQVSNRADDALAELKKTEEAYTKKPFIGKKKGTPKK